MVEKLKTLKGILFPKDADIRILAFNILAISGMIVSLVVAIYSFCAGAGLDTVAIELAGVIFSIIMIWYTMRTGKYQLAMIITIFVVFIGIFTGIFFTDGGYEGGAPEFFVFSIVFTAFLLEGAVAVIMVIIEILWYAAICVYAYINPQAVDHFSDEKGIMIDIVVCFIMASIALAITMYFQVRLYQKKQAELNAAREEADTANRAKSEFIAKMSHDIRTPLNTAMAMNQLIMQNAKSEDIMGWASDSEASCTLLLGLINDMLDISKIESGKLDIHKSDYSLAEMIKKLKMEWGLEAEKKGLELIFDIDKEAPAVLCGGFDALFKILSNLLSNAIKYTNKGYIRFTLEANKEADDEVSLKYTIEDTGIGIPKEYLDTIFLPFDRGYQTILKGTDGSGLGLAIVKELSELMSAKVSCESELEKGSVFVLEIKQTVIDDAPVGEIDYSSSNEQSVEKEDFIVNNARILVVDDNFFNRKVLRVLLEPYMIHIDDVESGKEALEMIEIKDYNLVFMDYRMPNMNGEETLRAIRDEYPDWDVPVVALTADAMTGTKEKLLAAGFDDFLTKPVNISQLKDVIVKFLEDKIRYFETDAYDGDSSSSDKLKGYELELNDYGVSVSQALENYDGNSSELLVRIEAFLEYYDRLYSKLAEKKEDEEAWKLYILDVHSLKSTAKGIGAKALSDLAALIELKNDMEFSKKTWELLLSEMELVYEGLKKIDIN